MTISLKHKFESAKADGDDNTLVKPSNWNDEHDLTMASGKLLGRTSEDAGAVEELDATAVNTLLGTVVAANNLSDVADVPTARANLYAAPMDAMAYLGMQVNGFHQISQENGDTAVTATTSYVVDQWFTSFSGPSLSLKRVAAPFDHAGVPYGIEIEATTGASLSSGGHVILAQKIEGQRVAKLGLGTAHAMPFSIGCFVRSNVSGRGHIALRNAGSTRSRVMAFDVVADTDTWVEIPAIPGDTTGTWGTGTGVGIEVDICIGAGSSLQTTADAWQAGNYVGASDTTNFMATTGNKFWVGPLVILPGVQVPSEEQFMALMRHPDDELRACQRYFQKVSCIRLMQADANAQAQFVLGVTMRTSPTIATDPSGNGTWSATGPGLIRQTAAGSNFGATTLSLNARL